MGVRFCGALTTLLSSRMHWRPSVPPSWWTSGSGTGGRVEAGPREVDRPRGEVSVVQICQSRVSPVHRRAGQNLFRRAVFVRWAGPGTTCCPQDRGGPGRTRRTPVRSLVTPSEGTSPRCPGPRATEIPEQHGNPYPRHQGLERRSLSEATAADIRAHPEFTSAAEPTSRRPRGPTLR